ncbi:hypothetical protein SVIOM74S_04635 [Streptomyces violarus]
MAAFQAFFYVVPALMIALAIFALTGIARRAQDVKQGLEQRVHVPGAVSAGLHDDEWRR